MLLRFGRDTKYVDHFLCAKSLLRGGWQGYLRSFCGISLVFEHYVLSMKVTTE